MPAISEDKKIGEMSASELKALIRDTIYEVIDPDYGLTLRPETEQELRESKKQKERGEGMPLEEVKKRIGLQ